MSLSLSLLGHVHPGAAEIACHVFMDYVFNWATHAYDYVTGYKHHCRPSTQLAVLRRSVT